MLRTLSKPHEEMADTSLRKLSAETLKSLDRGKLSATLEKAIQRAVQDCIDRPSDDRVRKVTLQFDLTPVVDMDDNIVCCDGVKAKYQVRSKVPDWESKELDFGVQRDGSLIFNEDAPENHRQTTMDYGGSKEE